MFPQIRHQVTTGCFHCNIERVSPELAWCPWLSEKFYWTCCQLQVPQPGPRHGPPSSSVRLGLQCRQQRSSRSQYQTGAQQTSPPGSLQGLHSVRWDKYYTQFGICWYIFLYCNGNMSSPEQGRLSKSILFKSKIFPPTFYLHIWTFKTILKQSTKVFWNFPLDFFLKPSLINITSDQIQETYTWAK